MSAIFYDHLIPWEKVEIYIKNLGLSTEDRLEVIELIEETIHTQAFIVILEHLPLDKHAVFIENFHVAPHDEKHLIFLREHSGNDIEDNLRKRIETVTFQVLELR